MKGICLTALGVLILSFDGLLIRLISVEAFDLLFWRGLLMSFMVLVILLLRKPNLNLLPRDAAALRSSFFLCISTITFVVAISLSSVANVLVIISSQPLFAAVLGWLVFTRNACSSNLGSDRYLHFWCWMGVSWFLVYTKPSG